ADPERFVLQAKRGELDVKIRLIRRHYDGLPQCLRRLRRIAERFIRGGRDLQSVRVYVSAGKDGLKSIDGVLVLTFRHLERSQGISRPMIFRGEPVELLEDPDCFAVLL